MSNIIYRMGKYTQKTFRASGSGLGKVLGHLEEEVMAVLWTRGEATGKEVLAELTRSRKIAFTTVLTVIERLARKGLLKRDRREDGYHVSPVYSKDEFAAMVSREVLDGVVELSSSQAVAS
ncbi:MAG: BlaI/MecI/CopY family transcriptional regulator, partial [Thermodesulfobacteriota bacterium]